MKLFGAGPYYVFVKVEWVCLGSKEKLATGQCQPTRACGARAVGLLHGWIDLWVQFGTGALAASHPA